MKNQQPVTIAVATVTLTAEGQDPIVTDILCDHFDACELALKVTRQYPGRTIAATHWKR